MFDRVAYGPDGLVEAVEVRDRSFIMGVQWHLNSLRARGKWGVFSLACAGRFVLHTATVDARGRCRLNIKANSPMQGRGRQWNMPMVFRKMFAYILG